MERLYFSASAMAADLLRFGEECASFDAAGFDELFFDVADGLFAPEFGANPTLVSGAKASCALPLAAHIMTLKADRHIFRFIEAGCTDIVLPAEARLHTHRALVLIKTSGARPGISLLPATPLLKVDYLLDFVERILLMRCEPGGGQPVPQEETVERIRILKEYVSHRRLKIRIFVDAPDTIQDVAVFAQAGASGFVLRDPKLFQGMEGLADFKRNVDARRIAVV